MAINRFKLFLLGCLLIGSLLINLPSLAANKATTTPAPGLKTALLIRPDAQSLFWDIFEEAMQAAADDLDVQLTSLRTNEDTIALIQLIKKVAASEEKPDVVFFHAETAGNKQIIRTLNQRGIDVFNVNTSIPEWEKPALGTPREKYKHWIGEFLPDDFMMGSDMAAHLQKEAFSKKLSLNNKVNVIALGGTHGNIASDERLKGLQRYDENTAKINLQTIETTNWRTEKSADITARLLEKYRSTHAIWAVSGETAIGALRGAEAKGLVPGQDIVIVCTDWLPGILDYVQEGKINATFGGHFIDGAWALILAYDYKNGYDIANNGSFTRKSKISAIHQGNADLYVPKLKNKAWKRIDFKILTQTHSPDFKAYNFDVLDLMKDVD